MLTATTPASKLTAGLLEELRPLPTTSGAGARPAGGLKRFLTHRPGGGYRTNSTGTRRSAKALFAACMTTGAASDR